MVVGADGRNAVDEGERRRTGMLPVRRWFVGDHEDVLAGSRLAVPAVREVEQAPAHDDDGDVPIVGTHEVGRRLRGPKLVITAGKGPADVSVAAPVEERADTVVVVGDERRPSNSPRFIG
jgi:hypothetical protein